MPVPAQIVGRALGAAAVLYLLLAVVEESHARDVVLRWTATGDDGRTGAATVYDLRWSTNLLNDDNFWTGIPVPEVPVPRASGTAESFTVRELPNTVTCYLAIRARDELGNWSRISNVVISPPPTASVSDSISILAFSYPAPNPASTHVRITLSLESADRIRVEVFDLAGRRVKTLADGMWERGATTLVWNLTNDRGARVEPGPYVLRANVSGARRCRLVLVLR